MMEVLTGRNLGLADEILAPNYVNRMTGGDLTAFKGMLTGMSTALSEVRFEIEELVAEGDSVVARWKMEATHTGSLMGEPPQGRGFHRAA
jgi:predicted ester cyclase